MWLRNCIKNNFINNDDKKSENKSVKKSTSKKSYNSNMKPVKRQVKIIKLEDLIERNKLLQSKILARKKSNQNAPKNKELSPKELRELKFHKVYYESSFLVNCLERDLLNYEKYITEIINNKRPIADLIINEIRNIVSELSDSYEVELYGSYTTGLCLPWSDLDFVICAKPGEVVGPVKTQFGWHVIKVTDVKN